jgi:hypothetical protein
MNESRVVIGDGTWQAIENKNCSIYIILLYDCAVEFDDVCTTQCVDPFLLPNPDQRFELESINQDAAIFQVIEILLRRSIQQSKRIFNHGYQMVSSKEELNSC